MDQKRKVFLALGDFNITYSKSGKTKQIFIWINKNSAIACNVNFLKALLENKKGEKAS